MIIKIWQYRMGQDHHAASASGQYRSFDIALGCSCYVIGIDVPGTNKHAFSIAERVGEYATGDDVSQGEQRIVDRYSDNLLSENFEDKVQELAVHAGSAGLERVWHFTWSHHPDEDVDRGIMNSERRIIRRILGLERCPGVGAFHGDEDHLHGHDVSVSVDYLTGDPIALGEYWWKEAAQIASAVCIFQHDLKPEPNRRYVADITGVYHTFTDTRIADADGTFLRGTDGKADHHLIKTMQDQHADIFATYQTPQDEVSGGEWPLADAVAVLAAPRIKKARNWAEVHQNLARVGLRYNKVGNTGVIEAVQFGDAREDREIAAGAAYSNAALGKLQKKLKQDYEPAPSGFAVRHFVMPRYDKESTDRRHCAKIENAQLRKEAKDLETHLRADNREHQAAAALNTAGKPYREVIGKIAARSRFEREFARDFAIGIGTRPKRRTQPPPNTVSQRDPSITPETFFAFLWSRFPSINGGARKALQTELEKRYRVSKSLGKAEYWDGDRLAFVETQNLIALRSTSRKAKIDALKLAKAKLFAVRVFGKSIDIADTLFLAAELGLTLEDHQAELGKQHRDSVAEDSKKQLLRRHQAWMGIRGALLELKPKVLRDRSQRARQADQFGDDLLEKLHDRNAIAADQARTHHRNDPSANFARMQLETVDRNSLMLASSRQVRGGYRFLDDRVLLQKFQGNPEFLLISQTQLNLEAIARIQTEKRKWVCAAILSGRVKIVDGNVNAALPEDRWVADFYDKQKADPIFARLQMVSRLRPDRFAIDLSVPPEITAWRAARATDQTALASSIADELHLSTRTNRQDSRSGADERDKLFKRIPHDAAELCATLGYFRNEYGGRALRNRPTGRSR